MSNGNESLESVLNQVRAAITEKSGLPFGAGAVEQVIGRLKNPFADRLKSSGAWSRDGENVLAAARQLGVIATAIANLRRNREITKDVMDVATNIVQDQCQIGFTDGRWCT